MKKIGFIRFAVVALLISTGIPGKSQQPQDAEVIRKVFDEALTSYEAYNNLGWLCKHTREESAAGLKQLPLWNLPVR